MADFTFAHREEGFDEHIEKSIREEMDEIRSKIDDLAAQAKRKFRKKS